MIHVNSTFLNTSAEGGEKTNKKSSWKAVFKVLICRIKILSLPEHQSQAKPSKVHDISKNNHGDNLLQYPQLCSTAYVLNMPYSYHIIMPQIFLLNWYSTVSPCCNLFTKNISLELFLTQAQCSEQQALVKSRECDSESAKTEEERGHMLWPRQGVNKQTGCQAISTHAEQTGTLTNLPRIYGTKQWITQGRRVRCENSTQVVLGNFGAHPYNLSHIIIFFFLPNYLITLYTLSKDELVCVTVFMPLLVFD